MNKISEYFYLARYHYWTAFLLPALVGTTLPFWLNPPGFSFKVFGAIEFLIAILFFYSGFFLLHAHFENKTNTIHSKSRLLLIGIICLLIAILVGLHINTNLELNKYVHKSIFIIYGFSTIIIGVLYVVPPFSFFKRMGGETILCVGVGMMPILGAYIIQAGDLTRTVYWASLPIVVSTGLWVWISELISRSDDESSAYTTMVMLFPVHFASRYVTTILTILIYLILVLAVFGRSSLNPLSLTALLSICFALKIISISMNEYSNNKKMLKARKYAFLIHLTICIIIIVSSLSTEFTKL